MSEFTRVSAGLRLTLEGCNGSVNNLMVIYSSKKKKKEVEETIRTGIGNWMKNNAFNEIRTKPIDVAIVIFVNKTRFMQQDCDNIAKPILDGLTKHKKTPNETRYLVENDAQIIRLLIYKLVKTDVPGAKTDEVIISFRKHDSSKQMILENKNVYV